MKRVLALSLLAVAPVASAQEPQLEPFSALTRGPAPGRANYYGVEGARIEGDLEPALGVSFDDAVRPLSVVACPEGDAACTSRRALDVVGNAGVFHLWGAVSFRHRAQLALALPVGFVGGDAYSHINTAGTTYLLSGTTRFGAGDPRMSARVHLHGAEDENLHLALSADATLPLSSVQGDASDPRRFLGNDRPTFGGRVNVEWVDSRFRIAGNLGGTLRFTRSVFDSTQRSSIDLRLAFAYEVRDGMNVIAELDASSDLDGGTDGNPLELRAAFQYHAPEYAITGGLGTRLVPGDAAPVLRIFGQFAWLPHRSVSDDDGDGIRYADDACPDAPEDMDGHRDHDGCPDPDNDEDGIPDDRDHCADEAEDLDGHADDDGCHDHDRDGDRVEDGYDGCPTEAEDFDGDRDNDGCPE